MEKKTLTNLRKEHNMTQEDLAILINLSNGAIGMYETGKRKPSLNTAIKIAQVFNINVENIIFAKK